MDCSATSKGEITALTPEERLELAAFLVELEEQSESDFRQTADRRMKSDELRKKKGDRPLLKRSTPVCQLLSLSRQKHQSFSLRGKSRERVRRMPDLFSGAKKSRTLSFGRAIFLNSSAATITTTGSPCRVTVCGPSLLASSTTWLNRFFARRSGHVFISKTVAVKMWLLKPDSICHRNEAI